MGKKISKGDDSYVNSTPEKQGLSDGKNVEGQNLPKHLHYMNVQKIKRAL